MVDYRTWMSIGLEQCTSSRMSQDERKAVFKGLAEGWSAEKEQIRAMDRQEVANRLECP